MSKKIKIPKTRSHLELFTHDTPYGHKVQKDKTKERPRKENHQSKDG
jgi:hypothetical protein